MIALPDTQNYAVLYPPPGLVQTTWVQQQVGFLNIKMVLHEGDLVNWEGPEAEWIGAKAVVANLGPDTPNLIAPGDHDYKDCDPSGRDLTSFNTHFPSARYTEAGWFNGGLANAGASENVCSKITIGDDEYLFIALEFGPRAEIIAWADALLVANPDTLAIIVTHSYLQPDNTYTVEGQALWDDLIKLHDNILCVLCGHTSTQTDFQAYRVDDNVNGHPIHQIHADYQTMALGGSGYLRVMRFVPSARKVYIETYSPYLEEWLIDEESEFNLAY